MKNFNFNLLTRFLLVLVLAALCIPAFSQNLPPTWVFARAYAGWNITGQQANTYTFNGGVCNYTPLNNGNSPAFFVFSETINGSTVYNPVYILDANFANSEIVTPTSTTQSTASCGASMATVNQHVSFNLLSGTAGLQEAVGAQIPGPPAAVILDQYWYNTVYGLPNHPTPESIITSITGTAGVMIVDATTSPWTYWRWNGSAYAAAVLTGGSAVPTAACGAACGSGPTISNGTGDGNTIVQALTTGTATTTGTLFTETWAATSSTLLTTSSFRYPPYCNVWSSGTNVLTGITAAVTYSGTPPTGHAVLTVTAGTAPAVSTAYQFKVVCQ